MLTKEQVGIVVQARMGSTRLPGKVLWEFCGEPLLLFLLRRIYECTPEFERVVATSELSGDDAIQTACDRVGVRCVRGSEENVLARFQQASRECGFAHIVRLTADNPLPDCDLLVRCIFEHLDTGADLTSTREILCDNVVRRYVPKGASVDVIRSRTLLALDPYALDEFDREHVIPAFFGGGYHCHIIRDHAAAAGELSIDTADDFRRVEAVARERGYGNCHGK